MLCPEGLSNPLKVFRENSGILSDNINVISKLDVAILNISADFNSYCLSKQD